MSNVGSKIKTFVSVITILGLISCIVLFFVGNAAYQKDKDCIEYATAYGGSSYGYASLERAGNRAYNGLQLRKLSLILAPCLLISALPLYAYGVLVDNAEQQTALLTQLLEEQKKSNGDKQQVEKKPVATAQEPKKSDNLASLLPEL